MKENVHFARMPWLRYITIGNPLEMAQLAEFGVVFLLFTIGLGLTWERLWTMRRLVFGLGGLQVVICAVTLSAAAAALGLDAVAAVVAGTALALSSTAMVMPLLAQTPTAAFAGGSCHLLGAAAPGSRGRPHTRDARGVVGPSR